MFKGTNRFRRAETAIDPRGNVIDHALVPKSVVKSDTPQYAQDMSELSRDAVRNMAVANTLHTEGSNDTHNQETRMTTNLEQNTTTAAIKSGRWSEQEHELFLEGLKIHGKNWKVISELVRTRSPVQIRTHAQKYFLKQARNLSLSGKITEDVVENVLRDSPAYGPYSGDSRFTIEGTRVCLPISALRASQKLASKQNAMSPITNESLGVAHSGARLSTIGRRHSTAVTPSTASRSLLEETARREGQLHTHLQRANSYHGEHPFGEKQESGELGNSYSGPDRIVPRQREIVNSSKLETSIATSAPAASHGLFESYSNGFGKSHNGFPHSLHGRSRAPLWPTPEHDTSTTVIGRSIRNTNSREEVENSPSCFTPPKSGTGLSAAVAQNSADSQHFNYESVQRQEHEFRAASLPQHYNGQVQFRHQGAHADQQIHDTALDAHPHSLPHHSGIVHFNDNGSQLRDRRKSFAGVLPHANQLASHRTLFDGNTTSKQFLHQNDHSVFQKHHPSGHSSFALEQETGQQGGTTAGQFHSPTNASTYGLPLSEYDHHEYADVPYDYSTATAGGNQITSSPQVPFAMESEVDSRMRVDSAYQFELETANEDAEMEDFLNF